MGYRLIGILQIVLTAILLLSLPLWKTCPDENETNHEAELKQENRKNKLNDMTQKAHLSETPKKRKTTKALSIKDIFAIPGAKEVMITFFCYCALEQTAGLWASSYLVLHTGIDSETAAGFTSLFYIGITVGRAISGFITMKLNDTQMIRMGQIIILVGIIILILPCGQQTAIAGLICIGLGCAPIYPCVIHSTPTHFGADKSQAVIGVQMASAYVGSCITPPIFGLLAQHITVTLFPFFLGVVLILMIVMHELLLKKTVKSQF